MYCTYFVVVSCVKRVQDVGASVCTVTVVISKGKTLVTGHDETGSVVVVGGGGITLLCD